MRTTLTLDDDVAAEIRRLRKSNGRRLKEIVNEALRRGINEMTSSRRRRAPFRTKSVELGRVYVNIDNIAEVIAGSETESFA